MRNKILVSLVQKKINSLKENWLKDTYLLAILVTCRSEDPQVKVCDLVSRCRCAIYIFNTIVVCFNTDHFFTFLFLSLIILWTIKIILI